MIAITPGPPPSPKIVAVTDAANRLSEFKIECGMLKAILEDVGNPDEITFEIDGRRAEVSHRTCLNPISDQYYYTVTVPPGTGNGDKTLTIRASGLELPPTRLEIL